MKYVNKGILFLNDKEKPSQPDKTGKADIECEKCGHVQHMKMAAWEKQGQKGPFESFNFQVKEEKQEQPQEPASFDQPLDDDIPF